MILVDVLIVVATLAIPTGLAVAYLSLVKRRQRSGRLRGVLVDPLLLGRDDTPQARTGVPDSLDDPRLPPGVRENQRPPRRRVTDRRG